MSSGVYNLRLTRDQIALVEACIRVVWIDVTNGDYSRIMDLQGILHNMQDFWGRIPSDMTILFDKKKEDELRQIIRRIEACPCCQCDPCDCHGAED